MRAAYWIGLLAAAGSAAADPALQRPVSEQVLAGVRGGYATADGSTLAIAVDVQRQTLPGSGNAVVVQNGADGRTLQTLTTIAVRSNALQAMNGLTLRDSVGAAIAHSLQR